MLLATKSQTTYGQGTHSFTLNEDVLTPARSDIMRAMFSTDFYSMNTHLTFTILLPPQLDPLLGHIYQGLRTLTRCLRDSQFRNKFQTVLSRTARKSIEGPTRKFRKWMEGPFAQKVQQLIFEDLPNINEKWAHELRDQRRGELLRRASKNRPKHDHDVEKMCMTGHSWYLSCGTGKLSSRVSCWWLSCSWTSLASRRDGTGWRIHVGQGSTGLWLGGERKDW